MPLTHYPNGLSTFGYPLIPPVPFMGDSRYYYVDVVNGNDGNSGTDPSQALQTIAKGYTLLRDSHYDTLFVIGLGTAFTLTAALNWTKNYTNLVGITDPINVSQRARITSGTSNTLTPMVTFNATGINVQNLQFAQFGNSATTSAVNVLVSGQRCYFNNVHFAGGGNATNRAGTAMRSLVVSGGGSGNGENYFDSCTIGLDTVDTAGVNYELQLTSDTPRNYFNNCLITRRTVSGGQGGGFIIFDGTGVDRYTIFNNLICTNFTIGGGIALTTAFDIVATSGTIIMNNPLTTGATGLSGGSKTNFLTNNAATASTIGLGLEPSS